MQSKASNSQLAILKTITFFKNMKINLRHKTLKTFKKSLTLEIAKDTN